MKSEEVTKCFTFKKKVLNLKIRKNTSLKGHKEAREPKLERQFEDVWPDILN